MPKSNQLSFERLLDWLEGRLSEEEAEAMAAQVAQADDMTRAEVDWLRAFVRVADRLVLANPPAETHEALRQRFNAHAQGRQPPALLQRFIAQLSFDSSMQLAASGVRAALGDTAARQLVYYSEPADIVLHVRAQGHDGHLEVNGQVLPTSDVAPDEFSVQLLRQGAEVDLAFSDDLGEFSFEAIPADRYDMILSTDRFEILITPVNLKM